MKPPSARAAAASSVARFRSANIARYRANNDASVLVRMHFNDLMSFSELGGAGSTDAYGLRGKLSLFSCDPWNQRILSTASWHVSATYKNDTGAISYFHINKNGRNHYIYKYATYITVTYSN